MTFLQIFYLSYDRYTCHNLRDKSAIFLQLTMNMKFVSIEIRIVNFGVAPNMGLNNGFYMKNQFSLLWSYFYSFHKISLIFQCNIPNCSLFQNIFPYFPDAPFKGPQESRLHFFEMKGLNLNQLFLFIFVLHCGSKACWYLNLKKIEKKTNSYQHCALNGKFELDWNFQKRTTRAA